MMIGAAVLRFHRLRVKAIISLKMIKWRLGAAVFHLLYIVPQFREGI